MDILFSQAGSQNFLTSAVLGFARAFPVLLVSAQLRALVNTPVAVALALVFSLATTGMIQLHIGSSQVESLPLLIAGNSIVGCLIGVLLSGCFALLAQIGRAMDNLTGARSVLNIESESGAAGLESFYMLVGAFLILELDLYTVPFTLYVELFNYVSPTLEVSYSFAQLEESSKLAVQLSLAPLNIVFYILTPLILSMLIFDLLGAFAARVMPEIPIAFELVGYRSLFGTIVSFLTVLLDLPERIKEIF